MNDVQIHLALNHFPVIGLFLATLVFGLSVFFKSDEGKKIGLLLLIFISVLTLPAYFSGEGAEEIVEELANMDHHVIHEHEEAAEPFIIVMSVLGILSLASFYLIWKKGNIQRWLLISNLILALFACTVAARVAHTGGLIRHPELNSEPTPSGQSHDGEEHKD